jgi:ribosomal protein S18 acetylase RimI-like enzyme
VNGVHFPDGYRLERLGRQHPRKSFSSGETSVDDWLASKALQNQEKRLSVTKVLLDDRQSIVGYYTLATGQIDFGNLPPELTRRLPRRVLPVAVLAWLGISSAAQGKGLGQRLLAQALRECHEAGQHFPFVAVILDCINDRAKAFYCRYGFQELPGHPHRLYLSASRLEVMMQKP